jgi:hypothetical protein
VNRARIILSLGLVAFAVACFTAESNAVDGGAPDAAIDDTGVADSSTPPADAGAPRDAAPFIDAAVDAGIDAEMDVDAAGPGQCADGAVCPIDLVNLVPIYPGLKLTWREGQPCDTVVGESEYGLISYPSQQTPPGPPLFTVPGTTLEYSDPTATGTNQHVYHARCVVGGVTSVWSNELADFGSVADGGDAGP